MWSRRTKPCLAQAVPAPAALLLPQILPSLVLESPRNTALALQSLLLLSFVLFLNRVARIMPGQIGNHLKHLLR